MEQWWWYLAEVPDYRAAPQERPDYSHDLGTEAPINPSFSSRFVGKRLEELTQWLINKPPNVFLDGGFFGVLDKQTERTGRVSIQYFLDALGRFLAHTVAPHGVRNVPPE